MKAIAAILVACIAASASYAGERYVPSKTHYEPSPRQEDWFADREFSFDAYGFWQDGEPGKPYSDGWGGGIGANAFFTRHLGVGVEGAWSDNSDDSDVIHAVTGTVIARYPIERVAPYVLAGVGGRFDSENVANVQVGGGIEFRVTRNVGLFTDGRYVFNEEHVNDVTMVRSGLRFTF